jgi:hypothetical protein
MSFAVVRYYRCLKTLLGSKQRTEVSTDLVCVYILVEAT